MNTFFKSSIGKKLSMALSAIFLMIFLLQHFLINITSVFSESLFNSISHFMGTNALVQFLLQPILIGGVLFHFIMGFILEIENRKAVSIGYAKVDGGKNSTWMSRNMIWSGIVILAFLVLHFIDFWFPEITYKYIEFLPDDPNRYYAELIHKFENPYRVGAYCFAFILLALHLLHGFTSSLKSLGTNKMYSQSVKVFAYIYSLGIPLGFCIIAIFHYYNNL
mgnify:CR=1 FL=1